MPITKVCIVTGATQGIGCHIVRQIGTISMSQTFSQEVTICVAAEKGSEVVLVDKSAEKVDKIRDEIVTKDGAAHSVPFDITNKSSVDQFSQLLDAAFPQVRIFITILYDFKVQCN